MYDGHAVTWSVVDSLLVWALRDVDVDVDCHFLFSTMADAGSFKGTSTDQDRFSDAETELLKSMEFPSSFDKKVR